MTKKRTRSVSLSNSSYSSSEESNNIKEPKKSRIEFTLPSSPNKEGNSSDNERRTTGSSTPPSEDEASANEPMRAQPNREKTPEPKAIERIRNETETNSPPRPKGSIQREARGFFTSQGFQPTLPVTSRKLTIKK